MGIGSCPRSFVTVRCKVETQRLACILSLRGFLIVAINLTSEVMAGLPDTSKLVRLIMNTQHWGSHLPSICSTLDYVMHVLRARIQVNAP